MQLYKHVAKKNELQDDTSIMAPLLEAGLVKLLTREQVASDDNEEPADEPRRKKRKTSSRFLYAKKLLVPEGVEARIALDEMLSKFSVTLHDYEASFTVQ